MERSKQKAHAGIAARILALVLACACALALFSGCRKKSADEIVDDIGTVIDIIDTITETPTPEPELTEVPTEAVPAETDVPESTDEPAETEKPEITEISTASPVPATEPPATARSTATPKPTATPSPLDENGSYYSKEDVALYIHLYGKLPSNFITKDDAKALGWSGSGSDKLEKYAPGKSIGGDYFGNYEKLLPVKNGRKYYECDIDTKGKVRGTKRIVFSNDGLIYYTEDHYETFTLLYGKP